jgi:hypothetical protein
VPLDSTTVPVVALGLAAFALVLVVVLAVRLGRLERARDAVAAGGRTGEGVAPSARAVRLSHAAGEGLRHDVDLLRTELAQTRADLATALRHVAVVRYDAFDDLAGRLSFSAALLDDDGDGVVLSSINGRSETRTYAKGVTAGGSGHPLSPEEKEAVARARAAAPVRAPAGRPVPLRAARPQSATG